MRGVLVNKDIEPPGSVSLERRHLIRDHIGNFRNGNQGIAPGLPAAAGLRLSAVGAASTLYRPPCGHDTAQPFF